MLVEALSQGIIYKSANFGFLPRLSVIFGLCRDFRGLLPPAETAVHNKWLPAVSACVSLLPVETLGRKHNHADSLGRTPFFADNSL